MRNMTKRRRFLMVSSSGSGGRLPEEYQEVAWLRGTGTQYCETGYKPNGYSNYFTSIKGDLTILDKSTGKLAIACAWGNLPSMFGIQAGYNNSFFIYYGSVPDREYSAVSLSSLDDAPLDVHYEINIANCVVNDYNLSITHSNYLSSNNLLIGAYQSNNTPISYNENVLIKAFRIYQNNELLTEIIPCYRKSDGKAGFYQTVAPQGSTNFLVNLDSGADWIIGSVV